MLLPVATWPAQWPYCSFGFRGGLLSLQGVVRPCRLFSQPAQDALAILENRTVLPHVSRTRGAMDAKVRQCVEEEPALARGDGTPHPRPQSAFSEEMHALPPYVPTSRL